MAGKNMTRVLVFGTFDKLNAGHIAFLERARRCGDERVVLVVEDEFARKYKGKPPAWSLKARMSAIRRLPLKTQVNQEDIRESWQSMKTIKPDVIVLSAEQAKWRHRFEALLKDYSLPARVDILPEIESSNGAAVADRSVLAD